MLRINNVTMKFGGVVAVNDFKLIYRVSYRANGAGKSSTLKVIMGLVKKAKGNVNYNGEDLTKLSTVDIVKRGIVLVPEGRNVFLNLTVEENLILGAYTVNDKNATNKSIQKVYDTFSILKERS